MRVVLVQPAATPEARLQVDHSQLIYTQRQGDLGIQTAVVKTFLRPTEILKLVEVCFTPLASAFLD